ncbi:MarR family winged helix-turn-helix transcriptional regulator [Aureibacillus halotolerans]|uniref:DNA-binding MarR family transcriptional regulator n=1 Tax=Aureibacillus halotolerans TaxID=1508390 RepID=A0A4V6PWF5_9BACI|nr:MarR family winged helix-turn-helix transcriptional regulator [Aureibacillus halotolerans]TDQ37727.1 DNA-binding MarR family transcriptional regulator [Aureibacillus halotolerans]
MKQESEALYQAIHKLRRKGTEIQEQYEDHTANEFRILHLLKMHPEGMKVSDVSTKLEVTSPFVTQLINSMEKQGVIDRRRSSDDRRVVMLMLTDKGEQAARKIETYMHHFFDGLVAYLGDEESRKLTELLHHVFDYLDTQKKQREEDAK